MTTKIFLPQARRHELVTMELKDEILIYDLKIKKAFCLNKTSALVWESCNGKNSIADITRSVNRKLKQTVTEDFVWLAIDGLKKENLLENSHAIETKFEGASRREMIRKVGLASLVALPLISSLLAPTAAMAQSASAAACGGTLGSGELVGFNCNYLCNSFGNASSCDLNVCSRSAAGKYCKSCAAHAIPDPIPGGPCNYSCVCN